MAALHNALVLAVDDDPVMRELLAHILDGAVGEVVMASSVEEAMKLLDCISPALIVSDLCMPEQDGYDLIRRVRSSEGQNQSTPAVALSAYAEDGCRDAALAAGFDMFLRKPLDLAHFVPVLEALLAG